jgi:hypothetical protein
MTEEVEWIVTFPGWSEASFKVKAKTRWMAVHNAAIQLKDKRPMSFYHAIASVKLVEPLHVGGSYKTAFHEKEAAG